MMRIAVAALPLGVLLVAAPARGQDLHGYAGGSFFISTQSSHRPGTSPDMPTTGVGGTTWGASGEIGAFLAPRFGVGVEFTLPARIEAIQETDYLVTFQNRSRYRDMSVAFVVRAYTPRRGAVRVAAVGGLAFVEENVWQSTAFARGPFPSAARDFGPFSDEVQFTRWTPAAVAGADLEVAIAPHVSLVPQVRAAWVSRSDDPAERTWFLGLNSFVIRPAVGVRAVF
jgi:hypothetical protein